MPDTVSPKKRSQIMSHVRWSGNKSTEGKLLKLFRKNKIKGWRRHIDILGRPDFIFKDLRVAIFVDGCFWHGCPSHLRIPSSNQSYWKEKIKRNRVRDRHVNRALTKMGWKVLRLWEHSLKNQELCVSQLKTRLGLNSNCRNNLRLNNKINGSPKR